MSYVFSKALKETPEERERRKSVPPKWSVPHVPHHKVAPPVAAKPKAGVGKTAPVVSEAPTINRKTSLPTRSLSDEKDDYGTGPKMGGAFARLQMQLEHGPDTKSGLYTEAYEDYKIKRSLKEHGVLPTNLRDPVRMRKYSFDRDLPPTVLPKPARRSSAEAKRDSFGRNRSLTTPTSPTANFFDEKSEAHPVFDTMMPLPKALPLLPVPITEDTETISNDTAAEVAKPVAETAPAGVPTEPIAEVPTNIDAAAHTESTVEVQTIIDASEPGKQDELDKKPSPSLFGDPVEIKKLEETPEVLAMRDEIAREKSKLQQGQRHLSDAIDELENINFEFDTEKEEAKPEETVPTDSATPVNVIHSETPAPVHKPADAEATNESPNKPEEPHAQSLASVSKADETSSDIASTEQSSPETQSPAGTHSSDINELPSKPEELSTAAPSDSITPADKTTPEVASTEQSSPETQSPTGTITQPSDINELPSKPEESSTAALSDSITPADKTTPEVASTEQSSPETQSPIGTITHPSDINELPSKPEESSTAALSDSITPADKTTPEVASTEQSCSETQSSAGTITNPSDINELPSKPEESSTAALSDSITPAEKTTPEVASTEQSCPETQSSAGTITQPSDINELPSKPEDLSTAAPSDSITPADKATPEVASTEQASSEILVPADSIVQPVAIIKSPCELDEFTTTSSDPTPQVDKAASEVVLTEQASPEILVSADSIVQPAAITESPSEPEESPAVIVEPPTATDSILQVDESAPEVISTEQTSLETLAPVATDESPSKSDLPSTDSIPQVNEPTLEPASETIEKTSPEAPAIVTNNVLESLPVDPPISEHTIDITTGESCTSATPETSPEPLVDATGESTEINDISANPSVLTNESSNTPSETLSQEPQVTDNQSTTTVVNATDSTDGEQTSLRDISTVELVQQSVDSPSDSNIQATDTPHLQVDTNDSNVPVDAQQCSDKPLDANGNVKVPLETSV